jgi:hypothetical protein
MTSTTVTWRVLAVALVTGACTEQPDATPALGPSFDQGGVRRPVVLVNPNSQGNGTATTIQEGIDMVAQGGRVMVKPGTYNEKVTIDKAVTLEGIDLDEGRVVIERIFARVLTPGFPVATAESSVVRVNTSDPVEIRNIGVHHVWVRGLIALTAPQLTLDNMSLLGEWDSLNVVSNNGITVVSRAAEHGGARAHLEIRNSRIDTDGVGIQLGGDVDALIEHNVIGGAIGDRNTRGTRIVCVRMSPKGQITTVSGAGMQLNVDLVNNDFIDCGVNNANAIAVNSDTGTSGTTGTGQVNIVGNRFVYSASQTKLPCNSTAIQYQYFSGRIEHNSFIGSIQSCANPTSPAAAIRIGNAPATPTVAGAAIAVRFNDVQGNLFGGLRVRSNQTGALDASCNYWGGGAPTVVTGVGTGAAGGGQDIVVEAGAATPSSAPYAAAPIAGTDAAGC